MKPLFTPEELEEMRAADEIIEAEFKEEEEKELSYDRLYYLAHKEARIAWQARYNAKRKEIRNMQARQRYKKLSPEKKASIVARNIEWRKKQHDKRALQGL